MNTLIPLGRQPAFPGRRSLTHTRHELFHNFNGEVRCTTPDYKVANDPRILSLHKGVPVAYDIVQVPFFQMQEYKKLTL